MEFCSLQGKDNQLIHLKYIPVIYGNRVWKNLSGFRFKIGQMLVPGRKMAYEQPASPGFFGNGPGLLWCRVKGLMGKLFILLQKSCFMIKYIYLFYQRNNRFVWTRIGTINIGPWPVRGQGKFFIRDNRTIGHGEVGSFLDFDDLSYCNVVLIDFLFEDIPFPWFFPEQETTGRHSVDQRQTPDLNIFVLVDKSRFPALYFVKYKFITEIILKKFQMIKDHFFKKIRSVNMQ